MLNQMTNDNLILADISGRSLEPSKNQQNWQELAEPNMNKPILADPYLSDKYGTSTPGRTTHIVQ